MPSVEPRAGQASSSAPAVRVLYDISALGGLVAGRTGLTGVPRVIENVLRGLIATGPGQCQITACAPASPALARACCQRYFAGDPLSLAPTAADGRPGRWVGAVDEWLIASQPRRALPWRLLRGALLPLLERARPLFGQLTDASLRAADIYHSPHGPIPAQIQKGGKGHRPQVALTVYDLIPFRRPEFFLPGMADTQAELMRTTHPKKDWYLCISQHTKDDLCELFKVDPRRVFVTPLAADPAVFYPCDGSAIARVRQRYNLPPGRYVMSLCTLEPRKNVRTVVAGFERIVRSGELDDLHLLLVGGKGWLDDDLREIMHRNPEVRRRILLPGYVPDEDLAPLYSGALCFAYLSHYEGFGLPPLEAMQCGVPVLSSNAAALPEVVGDAGLLFGPMDADGFAQGIINLARDESLHAALREKSLARSRLFSWRRCAQDTIAAYRQMLAHG